MVVARTCRYLLRTSLYLFISLFIYFGTAPIMKKKKSLISPQTGDVSCTEESQNRTILGSQVKTEKS